MDSFHDFIEQVRDANPIEDVIQEDGFPLRGSKMMKGANRDCDSLNVRTDWQRAWWYSRGWNGDVFGWVQLQKGCEFMEALELLAKRASLEMPKFQKVNEGEVAQSRTTADVFSTAAQIFQGWLLADEKALAYAKGRGWSKEIIAASLLGFSGQKTAKQVEEMTGEFEKLGIDRYSPQAVAVTGFQGDVRKWAEKRGLLDDPEFDKGWIEKKRIHGLMDTPGIIYAHQKPVGKVVYLSRRQLPGHDEIQGRAWKSFNPQKALVGPKQFYFNHLYRQCEPLVMVEGQGDAITWAQWRQACVAFCGLVGKLENRPQEEQERIMRVIRRLRDKHSVLYYCPDNDEAGEAAIPLVGKLFGPTIQIVRYSRAKPRDEKDA